jgi:hypothetical protein
MAFPGLGPVVPNTPYILVIPKVCHPSFLHADTSERKAMLELIDGLLGNERMFPCYHALVFEHGGIVGNSGCKCIDHCHLHVMNIVGSWARLPEVLKKYHDDKETVFDSNTTISRSSYLFAGYYKRGSMMISGRMAVIKGCREPQFFRALIGQMTSHEFDYRRGENLATMIETYKEAKKCF